ncbi:MAG TPA: acetylornithine deacetylase/succinyl-diaminopimelate desuccinylase family protein [Acidobacteriota bacterium]
MTLRAPHRAHDAPQPLGGNAQRVLDQVDRMADEIVALTLDLIRIPTVNPPGAHYRDCVEYLAQRLERFGFETRLLPAEGRPEHTPAHPRINLLAERRGRRPRPALHFNGHIDVVPAGAGWSVEPFAGQVIEDRIVGRGASDMKAGIAASLFAGEAVRRAGLELEGTLQFSATVDEESGGLAGMAHLCQHGWITRERCDYLVIPEPLGADRICLGHRGVLWLEVTTLGRIAHGSMPFLGVSAVDHMAEFVHRLNRELRPRLEQRVTTMPVEPPAARRATLNINGLAGGQPPGALPQSPCVADRCVAILDRRFLIEERPEQVRGEIVALLEQLAAADPEFRFQIRDLLEVLPVWTDPESIVVQSAARAIQQLSGHDPPRIASPGSYDQKHAVRLGGLSDCIAYGPGLLEQAHRPDEFCRIDDLVRATKVMALMCLDLLG